MTSSGSETDPRRRVWTSRLESWKEIAGYLGRDVRTAIRWERERGLPVHRLPGGRRRAVFAYPEELDAWIAGNPGLEPNSAAAPALPVSEQTLASRSHSLASYGTAAAVLIAAVFIAVAISAKIADVPAVADVRLERGAIVAVDGAGRELWRHTPEGGSDYTDARAQFIDFSRNGRPDVVVLLTEQRMPASRSDSLLRFSNEGALRWSHRPDDVVVVSGATYSGPWLTGPLAFMEIDGRVQIVWAVRDVTWWPALVMTFDADAKRIGTFVNAGWIRAVVPHGDRILISGFSNSAGAGMAAVIDGRSPSGRSPEDPAGQFFCPRCPDAPPLRYVIFGRSEINRVTGSEINAANILRYDRGIEVHTQEIAGTSSEVIYDVNQDLDVIRARFGDRYWDEHRRLEQEGRIAHASDKCPERAAGLAVRVWPPPARN